MSGGFLVPCRVEGFPLYKGGSYFTDPPRLPASDHRRVMRVLPDIFNGLMETTPEADDLCALACWQVANSVDWRVWCWISIQLTHCIEELTLKLISSE
jgi:hypothetical protein